MWDPPVGLWAAGDQWESWGGGGASGDLGQGRGPRGRSRTGGCKGEQDGVQTSRLGEPACLLSVRENESAGVS